MSDVTGEKVELFYSPTLGRDLVAYDYTWPDGRTFSCVDMSVDLARAQRDRWLATKGDRQSEEPHRGDNDNG